MWCAFVCGVLLVLDTDALFFFGPYTFGCTHHAHLVW